MPVSRLGTLAMSISMPVPARAPISRGRAGEPRRAHVLDAHAPRRVFRASRQASSSTFSMKGSPTCTVGRFSSLPSPNSAEAMVAPWIPSRPGLGPHVEDGVADALRAALEDPVRAARCPRQKALTSGFCA